MEYRLLVDLEAIAILDAAPKRIRAKLLQHFGKLRSAPGQCSDAHEQDSIGRRVEISIIAGYCIHYWIDSADQHVKVLALTPADK